MRIALVCGGERARDGRQPRSWPALSRDGKLDRLMREPTATTLARWRTARRAVLGAIVLAGAVATSTAIVRQVALSDCPHHRGVDRAYTYSGIGVVIEREDDGVVIKRVIGGAPAEG